MNLKEIIQAKYPAEVESGLIRCGNRTGEADGWFIEGWDVSDPEPSTEDVLSWTSDPNVISAHQTHLNSIVNKLIYDQLNILDFKSIRALRSNDTKRIADIETQAAVLRAKLVK